MKRCLLTSCLIVVFVVAEKYTSKYDHLDVAEVLENKRLLRGYADCLLDRGRCVPVAKEIKEHLIDALQTGCKKCTDVQKDKGKAVIIHLINNERGIWDELANKYDPEGVWRKKNEEESKKKGIFYPKD